MSWASHNPEAYEEIERNGVVSKIEAAMKDEGLDEYDHDTVCAVVETLQRAAGGPTVHNAWSQLTLWSNREVSCAYGEHFTSIADARE